MLAAAGISSSIEIGPAPVLAMKAGLALPWNKLELLRWYDIINACFKGNSLFIKVSDSSMLLLLKSYHGCRAGRLTWREGFIPASEVWIKIGGDKLMEVEHLI